MKKFLTKKTGIIVTLLLAVFTLMPILTVQALVIDDGLSEVQTHSGLGGQDLEVLIGEVIGVVLGVLGIILVLLIIYAGFLWMTAQGDDDKVKKAKDIIRMAIIGLIIILAAYSITTFLTGELQTIFG